MQSETLLQTNTPESLTTIIYQMMGDTAAMQLDEYRRAASAWFMANGDVERQHTVKVWLHSARYPQANPVMVVEVDSHALISDFNAKRDIYLGRLAHYGQQVSRIEFRYSPQTHSKEYKAVEAEKNISGYLSEDPSSDLYRYADKLALQVPSSLRDVVRRAVIATVQANK